MVHDERVTQNIKEYLDHSTQELFQSRLYDELKISTIQIEGKRWPGDFRDSVDKAITEIREARDKRISALEVD